MKLNPWRKLFIGISILTSLILQQGEAPADCRPAEPVRTSKCSYLHVLQTHNVLGPVELFASPAHSLMKLPKLDSTIFLDCRKKVPEVLVVSPRKRTFYQVDLDKFDYGLSRTLDTVTDLDMNSKAWKLVEKKITQGMTISHYVHRGIVRANEEFATFLPGKTGNTTVKSEYQTGVSPLAPSALCHLLKKMEHVPDLGGVPLQMYTSYSGKSFKRQQISTSRIETISIPELKHPSLTGLRRTDTSADAFFGNIQMMDLLGK